MLQDRVGFGPQKCELAARLCRPLLRAVKAKGVSGKGTKPVPLSDFKRARSHTQFLREGLQHRAGRVTELKDTVQVPERGSLYTVHSGLLLLYNWSPWLARLLAALGSTNTFILQSSHHSAGRLPDPWVVDFLYATATFSMLGCSQHACSDVPVGMKDPYAVFSTLV